VRNLNVLFRVSAGEVHAVRALDLDVAKGETVAIVGESGSGKSQAALAVMGLLAANGRATGSVRYRGLELLGTGRVELNKVRGSRICMIFQEPMTSLDPLFRIGRQLALPLIRHQGMTPAAARRRAIELLDEVGIDDPAHRINAYAHELSGGQRQRVMIAMALANGPELLIADEPTTALDVTVQAGVLDLLDELRLQHNMTMIMITHNMGVVAETADDILVMYAGQVVEQAPAVELFARPEHPYTEALLASLPHIDRENVRHERLVSIPGRPPDLLVPPEGCRFAARCRYAGMDDCHLVAPELREVRENHWVRSQHPASERTAALVGAG
jgi:oligopeptide transport system ATP-binding protein